MKRNLWICLLLCYATSLSAQIRFPQSAAEDTNHIMSDSYWSFWNPKVQQTIDRDIEKNRKANARIQLADVQPGSNVEIEQTGHDFIFGAHIFNFDQLGSAAANQRYKALFGDLFNSATVAFYWKKFEMQPNRPRFRQEYWDTEAYWNRQTDPKSQPHWRRPSSDQVVDFCVSKGIRVHGHPMIWGNRKWHHPNWILSEMLTPEEKSKMDQLIVEYATVENYKDGDVYSEQYQLLTPEELESEFPVFTESYNALFTKRIQELAHYYGDRVNSWDVVNESASDFANGILIPDAGLCKSAYGLMPGDYTYKALKQAGEVLSNRVDININDYFTGQAYVDQVNDLLQRGARIDIMGSQMHLFDPKQCKDISEGAPIQTPEAVWETMNRLSAPGLPIHLSEITITSPGSDERSEAIQAIIAQNLYRLWFSIGSMVGITWWNVVDDCGAPGEPSVSGLFKRDMQPKAAYFALNQLINQAWKTHTTAVATSTGEIQFRGFKGTYLIRWTDTDGQPQSMEYKLK